MTLFKVGEISDLKIYSNQEKKRTATRKRREPNPKDNNIHGSDQVC
jgi:hypothetical protein